MFLKLRLASGTYCAISIKEGVLKADASEVITGLFLPKPVLQSCLENSTVRREEKGEKKTNHPTN